GSDMQVVDLAEHTGAPAPKKSTKVHEDAMFGPPPEKAPTRIVEPLSPDTINLSPSDDKIELETGWRSEKAARQAGRQPLSPLAQRVVREDQRRRAGNTGFAFA